MFQFLCCSVLAVTLVVDGSVLREKDEGRHLGNTCEDGETWTEGPLQFRCSVTVENGVPFRTFVPIACAPEGFTKVFPPGQSWTEGDYEYTCAGDGHDMGWDASACFTPGGTRIEIGSMEVEDNMEFSCKNQTENGEASVRLYKDSARKCSVGDKMYSVNEEWENDDLKFMCQSRGTDVFSAVTACKYHHGSAFRVVPINVYLKIEDGTYVRCNESSGLYDLLPVKGTHCHNSEGQTFAPDKTWEEGSTRFMCSLEELRVAPKAIACLAAEVAPPEWLDEGESIDVNGTTLQCQSSNGTLELVKLGQPVCAYGDKSFVFGEEFQIGDSIIKCELDRHGAVVYMAHGCWRNNTGRLKVGETKEVNDSTVWTCHFEEGQIRLHQLKDRELAEWKEKSRSSGRSSGSASSGYKGHGGYYRDDSKNAGTTAGNSTTQSTSTTVAPVCWNTTTAAPSSTLSGTNATTTSLAAEEPSTEPLLIYRNSKDENERLEIDKNESSTTITDESTAQPLVFYRNPEGDLERLELENNKTNEIAEEQATQPSLFYRNPEGYHEQLELENNKTNETVMEEQTPLLFYRNPEGDHERLEPENNKTNETVTEEQTTLYRNPGGDHEQLGLENIETNETVTEGQTIQPLLFYDDLGVDDERLEIEKNETNETLTEEHAEPSRPLMGYDDPGDWTDSHPDEVKDDDSAAGHNKQHGGAQGYQDNGSSMAISSGMVVNIPPPVIVIAEQPRPQQDENVPSSIQRCSDEPCYDMLTICDKLSLLCNQRPRDIVRKKRCPCQGSGACGCDRGERLHIEEENPAQGRQENRDAVVRLIELVCPRSCNACSRLTDLAYADDIARSLARLVL